MNKKRQENQQREIKWNVLSETTLLQFLHCATHIFSPQVSSIKQPSSLPHINSLWTKPGQKYHLFKYTSAEFWKLEVKWKKKINKSTYCFLHFFLFASKACTSQLLNITSDEFIVIEKKKIQHFQEHKESLFLSLKMCCSHFTRTAWQH